MPKQKIKITHILPELGFGGAERLLVDIASKIDRDKFDLEIICLIKGGEFEDEFAKLGIPVKIFHKKGKLGLSLIWQVKKYLEKSNPDIVHTHLFAGDFWGRISASLAGVKNIVSTEHNLNVSEGKIKDWLKIQTNKLARKIIAVSTAVKNYAIEKYKLDSDKIKVIYNGIDLSRFGYKEPDLNKDKVIFGTVGRLTEQKGHKCLISAFAQVVQKIKNAQLWIVGAGELKAGLEKQITALNLDDKVKLLGVRKDIPKILHEFDIFVMPSLWEGLGIAVVEAMASGLPVVVSNVDGLAELVEDNQNGFLVEPKNADDLAQKMISMYNNKELAKSFSKKGRELVENKFDLDKIVREYEGVYEEVLA